MQLTRRLERLERHAGHLGDVTWDEFYAADERIGASALGKIQAALDGELLPVPDPEQQRRDAETVRRWSRQQGVDHDAICAQARENLERRLLELRDVGCDDESTRE